MSDDLEQRLRATLSADLDPVGQTNGDLPAVMALAARMRSRRRAVLGATALVAAAAIAVASITVLVDQGGDIEPAHPASTAATPTDCPAANVLAPPVGHSPLPTGANRAILCPINGAAWQPPNDALTTDLADLIDVINTRPPAPTKVRDLSCASDHLAKDYAIIFDYPDGTTARVWGNPCDDTLFFGEPKRRLGAMTVLGQYLALLEAQG